MRKILALSLAVIFGIVLFTSCGGGGTKSAKLVGNAENGKDVYDRVCIACHMTGVAGAAALDNKERWEENAAMGMKALHLAVINGVPDGKYGVMAERGSCTDCSDQDLYDAIVYMLGEANVTAGE